MKREHVSEPYYPHCGPHKFYALLWKFCGECHKEFRFEYGWKYEIGPFFNGVGKWKYLCVDCIPNLKAATKIATGLRKKD